MNEKDEFEYNNEEEAEMAQLHSIHLHMNAIADVRRKLAKAAEQESLTECEDCGEEIPQARRLAVKGVMKCVFCQQLAERRV